MWDDIADCCRNCNLLTSAPTATLPILTHNHRIVQNYLTVLKHLLWTMATLGFLLDLPVPIPDCRKPKMLEYHNYVSEFENPNQTLTPSLSEVQYKLIITTPFTLTIAI